MNSLFGELRHALRSLRKQPGFFFCALLTMTLGIGVTKATYNMTSMSVFG